MPATDAAGLKTVIATELEERLRATDGARLRAELLTHLADLSQRVAADMNSGLPASDFARADAICKALKSAHAILAMFPCSPP